MSAERTATVSNYGINQRQIKHSMNNFYELTYILNPVLDEEQFSGLVDKINSWIEENGGKVVEVDEWGVKKLSYEIDKKSTGYYVNLYFEAPGEAIEVIERNMKIDDDVMRYLTLKYDAKMMRHYNLRQRGELPTLYDETAEETEDEN